jgi:hypothetical protein
LGAAEKPFAKGSTYLNLDLMYIGRSDFQIGDSSMLGVNGDRKWWGNDRLYVGINNGGFAIENRAMAFSLEYGLTSFLGLELQFYERSGYYHYVEMRLAESETVEQTFEMGSELPEYTQTSGTSAIFLPFDSSNFKERVLSLGVNYHMNFIKITKLDMYTGFQVGIEDKSFMISRSDSYPRLSHLKFINQNKELELSRIQLYNTGAMLIYANISMGLRYFITDRIAINLRSSLKLGMEGWDSLFCYSTGLTLKL